MATKFKIFLKELSLKDVSNDYVKWLNNYEIVKFTDQKNKKHTLNNVKKFVKTKKISKNEFLFGIFLKMKRKNIHVGNIKLGPINFLHLNAQISYFVGRQNLQGIGIGTMAIKKVVNIAKKKFKLKKVIAYIYPNNISSKKVLEKNKFILEGKIKKMYLFNNKRVDGLIYGKNI